MILVYGTTVYPSVRSSRTIRNIEISSLIPSCGFTRDYKFEIRTASLSIVNNGPLEVILRDVNMTITLENDGSLIIPVEDVSISPNSNHTFTLAPPPLTAAYEPHRIIESLQDYHLEYQLNMSAFASSGTFQGPISKTSDGIVVFLHIPTGQDPASFQHGVALGQEENETIVMYTTAPQYTPQSFRVGRINDQWTDRKHFWGTEMIRLEKIRFTINASEPVNLQIILASGPDLSNYTPKEVLMEISSTSYIHKNFTAPIDGLYVFRFQINQPLSTSTVIFDCVRFWP